MVLLDRLVRVLGLLRRRGSHQDQGVFKPRELRGTETGERNLRDAQLRVAARLGYLVALDAVRRRPPTAQKTTVPYERRWWYVSGNESGNARLFTRLHGKR